MSVAHRKRLNAHLRRHARTLHHIACGFGRRGDADDVLQILYARWWQRMRRDPGWAPPEDRAELFVCVKRVVIDESLKEKRLRQRHDRSASEPTPACPPDESLHAFERLQWILSRMPAHLAEALQASLSAGRRKDPEVARELGISPGAFTARLYKARRAAEELATYYDVLSPEQAHLMAELRFSGKTRSQVAHELSLLTAELTDRWRQALALIERNGRASAL